MQAILSIFVITQFILLGLAIMKTSFKGSKWLCLYMLSFASHIILRFGMFIENNFIVEYLPLLLFPGNFFIGCSLFLYIEEVLFSKEIRKIFSYLIVPWLIPLIHLFFLLFIPDQMNISMMLENTGIHQYYTPAMGLTMIIYNAYFCILALLKVRKYDLTSGNTQSSSAISNSKWLSGFALLSLLLLFIKGGAFLYSFINLGTPFHYIDDLIMLPILLVFNYYLITRPKLLFIITEVESPKYAKMSLSDAQRKDCFKRLESYMKESEAFLDSDLSLSKVSEDLDIPKHYLSIAINTEFQNNFFHYVNQYRTIQAGEMLSNTENDQETLLSIAFSAGFQSKSTFNRIFRNFYKMTPSEFRSTRMNNTPKN